MSWNRCLTEDQCRADWDKYRIAHIKDMTKVYVDYPERFELNTNGTLTIKEVLPEDDNKIFICRGRGPFETVENITVLEIIRGKIFLKFSFEYTLTLFRKLALLTMLTLIKKILTFLIIRTLISELILFATVTNFT